MSKVQNIISELKELTLLEASELVKEIENVFGVSAAAPMMVGAPVAQAGDGQAAVAEEKTEFNVVVKEVPADKKIAVIKVVKTALNIGLADAKTKVEAAPFVVVENTKKEDAEKLQKELVEAGAVAVLE